MYGADPDTISEGGSIASDMLGDTSGVAHTGLVGLHGGAYGTVGGTGIGLSGNSITIFRFTHNSYLVSTKSIM